MLEDDEIYVVVDIETDGPVPGLYSMLSLAAVATSESKEVGAFYRKILSLDGASQEPSTMAWWKTQAEAWGEVSKDALPADKVLPEFSKWLSGFAKTPIFVAHPVAFDYTFVSWYLWKFTDGNPFANADGSSRALDLPSFISGKYGLTLTKSRRYRLPEWMKDGMPEHSHNALEDAKGFAVILRNALRGEDENNRN